MPTISVIVPVYNVEPYLRRCVDSILNQTYTDFELILVDDGSPDNCPAICDEYAAKDSRVQVIHQANGGVSSARNAGLDIARGEYVTFVDSDDRVDIDYLTSLMNSSADLLCQGYVRVGETGEVLAVYHVSADVFKVNKETLAALLYAGIFNGPWAKKYRLSVIREHNIRFEVDLSFGEDRLFVVEYAKAVDTVQVDDTTKYCYTLFRSRRTLSSEYSQEKLNILKRANHLISGHIADGDTELEKEIYKKRMLIVLPYYLSELGKNEEEPIDPEYMDFFKENKKQFTAGQYKELWWSTYPIMKPFWPVIYSLFRCHNHVKTQKLKRTMKRKS